MSDIKNDEIDQKLEPYNRPGTDIMSVSFRINGKLYQRSTKEKNIVKARRAAVRIYKQMLADITSIHPGKIVTLDEACEAFLDAVEGEVATGTHQMYRSLCNRMRGVRTYKGKIESVQHLIEPYVRLDRITQEDMDVFTQSIIDDYKSRDAAKLHLNRLNTFLSFCRSSDTKKQAFAIKQDFTLPDKNSKTVTNQPVFTKPKKRDRIFTYDQLKELMDILRKSRNPENYALVMTLCDLPIRIGEAVRLEWSDITFAKKEIYIRRSKKSLDTRARLSDRLVEALKEQKARAPEDSIYVFPSETSLSGYRSTKNMTWWHKALNDMKDKPNSEEAIKRNKGQRLSPHSIRHTIGVFMAQGLNPSQMMQVFGHSSIQQSLYYGKLRDSTATDTLAEMINQREVEHRVFSTYEGTAANDEGDIEPSDDDQKSQESN